MIYVNDNFDSRFKYLVDYGSNFLVLSTDSYSQGSSGDPDVLPCKLVYLSPSFTSVDFTYYSFVSESFSDISDDFTTNLYYASDFPITLITSFILLLCLCLIFNGFTRIIQKGGLLFPH